MSDQSELKSIGLKATFPRLKILDVFRKAEHRHMSADDVYRLLMTENIDIGLATVYRVLTQFEEAGILLRSQFDGGKSVFELNGGEHHDHLVCTNCGRVEEFHDAEIERRQQEIADRHGFKLTEHALSLYGLCSNCAPTKG
jgi:Fur family ferric uptake transcriptional regulator